MFEESTGGQGQNGEGVNLHLEREGVKSLLLGHNKNFHPMRETSKHFSPSAQHYSLVHFGKLQHPLTKFFL